MEFKIKKIDNFKDVTLIEGNTEIVLGFLNEEERYALSATLLEAVFRLVSRDFTSEEEYKDFILMYAL